MQFVRERRRRAGGGNVFSKFEFFEFEEVGVVNPFSPP